MCAMNPSKDSLAEALRELAAASPQGAPPELGARLRSAFARHHAWRRKRMALATGLAACLAISLSWWAGSKQPPPPAAPREPSRMVQRTEAPPAAAHATELNAGTRSKSKSRRVRRIAPPPAVASADFLALPSFDPAVPIGQARIVRMEMPGSALQLVGYPVNEELLQRRVVTDMLVGQDGMPYAVRLVQTRANH